MCEQELLRLENVKKDYKTSDVIVTAVKDTSVTFSKGELVVILGQSGSGKSTLLNLIGGIDRVTEGKVYFKDRDISKFNSKELTNYRKEHVGFIFQFYNLIPNLTVRENIELATSISSSPLDINEIARLIDLENYLDHFPTQLSGGQQQRVAIARAVAKNPEVLLCDEPTGALDSTTGKLVLNLLREVNRIKKNTTIMVTHNVSIGKMADRLIKMKDGVIVEDSIVHNTLSPERIEW